MVQNYENNGTEEIGLVTPTPGEAEVTEYYGSIRGTGKANRWMEKISA